MHYVAKIHPSGRRWRAEFPDIPGCAVVAATEDEAVVAVAVAVGSPCASTPASSRRLPASTRWPSRKSRKARAVVFAFLDVLRQLAAVEAVGSSAVTSSPWWASTRWR